jgi:hypothetical protein
MRHRLSGIHLAPLPLAVGPELRDALLHFGYARWIEEILHTEERRGS